MAPELLKNTRRYTNKVGMWAVGLIGVQLLTAWEPNSFGTWHSVILHHVEEAPEEFCPLLKGLLHKAPRKRWSADKCLRWLWRHIQAEYSQNPSVSTTRARGVLISKDYSEGSTIRDMLTPSEAASIPNTSLPDDEEYFDDQHKTDESMNGSDAKGDDWREGSPTSEDE
ncbi:hypothetical protein PAAG_12185 [Paracoccidioides lutzii Pb01]|uniref:Protein kinase domain-containing protein n=1 Tax=Paracoccidioides lutzii (strain ATCC MYA-826 / Pb01) TaxID=502779 RepID=A0A0A2V476_PARBA|nr:hypothetical protein PAAG_12185 [Paracoccidioides lutzii Pb01]KGQ01147.1 hypothetical protein PAAG_12185 [Paracoccidioides lutzii Pb01]